MYFATIEKKNQMHALNLVARKRQTNPDWEHSRKWRACTLQKRPGHEAQERQELF